MLSPRGEQVLRHVDIDYADRPDEQEVLEAVRPLGLPARSAPEGFPRQNLLAYFRGVRSGADALVRRGDEQAATVRAVAERLLAALP